MLDLALLDGPRVLFSVTPNVISSLSSLLSPRLPCGRMPDMPPSLPQLYSALVC